MTRWVMPFDKFGDGPDLARVSAVAEKLGLDLAGFGAGAAIVVGSNGKGSAAAMAAALLGEVGGPVGLFTSPHLFAPNERFRIDGADISDADLARHWRRVLKQAEGSGIRAAEFLFLIAADWFSARGCGFTVWEAGIGGRDDAVRLIEARRVGLTALDFEHTGLLGSSLAEIARNKIDAAPAGAKLFWSSACDDERETIEAHARARGVTAMRVEPVSLDALEPPLAGPHQRGNAALALALARDLAPIDAAQARRGLAATRWPGRLEIIGDAPLIVIDVGHTPDGVRAALAGFEALRAGRPAVLACGASADKDAAAIVSILAPAFDAIFCAAARHKGAPAAEIAKAARAANPNAHVVEAESVAAAHAAAFRAAGAEGAIYAAGGLFLAAEFKAVHEGRDPASLAFF
mgnify:CR=1 FL=1